MNWYWNIYTMKIFVSLLWLLLLSEVVPKFLFDDTVSENVEICEEIHRIAIGKKN